MKKIKLFVKMSWDVSIRYYILLFVSCAISGVQVFLNLSLPALFIEALTTGSSMGKCGKYAAIIVLSNVILFMCNQVIEGKLEVEKIYVNDMLNKKLSQKIMTLGYDKIENPYYLDLRQQAVYAIEVQDLYGVAHMDESILYKEFGANAEFLIDHSKGYEPCTIKEIHDYKPKTESISNGQILFNDYNFDDALIVLYEMVDQLVLELTQRKSKTNSISLYVRYSKECTASTGGTRKLNFRSSSYSKILSEFEKLYRETTKKNYPIRQINVGLNNIEEDEFQQLDLFGKVDDDKEIKVQKGIIEIKNKFGKNAVLRCSSLQDKATARIRNKLVGGHNGE